MQKWQTAANARIKEALDWIAVDLTRPENASVWPQLQAIEPARSRIDLFDMIWWMYFRQVEPVAAAPTNVTTVGYGSGVLRDRPPQPAPSSRPRSATATGSPSRRPTGRRPAARRRRFRAAAGVAESRAGYRLNGEAAL